MPEHNNTIQSNDIATDSPLVSSICGADSVVVTELAPTAYNGEEVKSAIFDYFPNVSAESIYVTIEYGVCAIVDSAKESLDIINAQIDQLNVSDECKEFLKKELPHIVKDLTVLAIKGGWYTLTSSSGGEAVFEMDLSSSAMRGVQEAITKRIGGDLAKELFDRNVGGYVDPLLEPYTDVKVSAIMAESIKIVVGSVILGGANLPYAFAKAIANKALSWAYNNETAWEKARSAYNQGWGYLGYPTPKGGPEADTKDA